MDCTHLQTIFSGARADDLSDAESRAFEEHLRGCETCAEKLAQAEESLEPLVERMEPPAVADAAWDKVNRTVKLEASRPVLTLHAGGNRMPRVLAFAAAFLLAAGIGAFLPLEWVPGQSKGPTNKLTPDVLPPPPPAPIGAAPGQRVIAKAVEAGERFEAEQFAIDCGEEQVLLISVRSKDL